MRELFRDSEHLVRLLLLFAAGTLLFLVVRALLVPDGFGEYGHFRSGAIADTAARPPAFAGRAACAECHDEVVVEKAKGAHAGIGCESCHGALGEHAADPDARTPELPAVETLCVRCHEANLARPASFPQVDIAAHAEGASCAECHEPHRPDA